ncbi:hypothetical protein Tco_0322232 [Tanacetum coccineum]
MAKKIDTRLDAEEEINTGIEEINTGIEEISTGSTKVDSDTASKRDKRMLADWKGYKDIKLEANAKLSKDVLGQDLPEQDFAKRMAEMVNQRKKHFAEERAKAKLKLLFLINLESYKGKKLKRYREELQTKTSKKQTFDDKDVPAIGEKVAEVKEE